MITRVFAVYDLKAKAYMAPFFMLEVGQAIREFGDAVNDPKTGFNRHPSDYVLFQVASFDDNSGEFATLSPAAHLGIGSDFISHCGRVPAPLPGVAVDDSLNGVGKPALAH